MTMPDDEFFDDFDEDELQEREQPDIETTLAVLQTIDDDTLDSRIFYGLSSLSADDLTQISPVWQALPVEQRRRIMQRLVDISETNVELDYHTFALYAMGDDDAEVREAAVETLWEDSSSVFMNTLIDMTQWDEAIGVRAAAASALGQFALMGEIGELPFAEAHRVQDVLVALLNDEDEDIDVRRRALEAIANSSHEIVDEAILDAYQGTEERMRASAIYAMGRTADPQWEEFVLREMDSGDPAMRYEAAKAAGELEIEEAIPALGRMAQLDDVEIREVAVWALGEIGGGSAMRLLGRLADMAEEDGNLDLLEVIEEAIGNASLAGAEMDFDFDEE